MMRKFYFFIAALLFGLNGKAQIVDIPDANFKARLIALGKDINADGEIQQSEAALITTLNLSYLYISSLTGIEHFTNLTYLNCSSNSLASLNISTLGNLLYLDCSFNNLTALDATGAPHLTYLDCSVNNMFGSSLHVSTLYELTELNCGSNNLSALDVSQLTSLTTLGCSINHISTLNVSQLVNLVHLDCSQNQGLSVLDLSSLTHLEGLNCYLCNLSTINLSNLTSLKSIDCGNNNLNNIDFTAVAPNLIGLAFGDSSGGLLPNIDFTPFTHLTHLSFYGGDNQVFIGDQLPLLQAFSIYSSGLQNLDLSSCIHLNNLSLRNNYDLVYLNVKSGVHMYCSLNYNPNLKYICANEADIASFYTAMSNGFYNYATPEINSYCAFQPGGLYNTINGTAHFDNDQDGCDVTDPVCSNVGIHISDGIGNGTTYTNNLGGYTFSVQQNSLTLNATVENPGYFNIAPLSATLNFDSNNLESQIQDFCLTPNGIHPDLEVSVLPLDAARPGFDAHYRILYKNKGNQIQSGTFYIGFDGSLMDYVSSSVPVSLQSPSALSWNFNNLAPFETRTVNVVFNLNSAVETPPLNGGDTLHYTAVITSFQTDDSPADNSFGLAQTVVNSFDPNDKTCLEGNTVDTEMIGKYVHYLIRFENNGTANAQNIVVKDMIDTAKFDISSLIPLDGSHPFTTRITNDNKVEFIFENIQLPFDDANNDGYVAFKIRTLPTLVTGETFSNSAGIYFDYNAPIVTNTATTAIQALGIDDIGFNKHFTLFPNPAANILTIRSNNGSPIQSVSVYNMLGQLVLTVTNPTEAIAVSALVPGNYFVKVYADGLVSAGRFIKQ